MHIAIAQRLTMAHGIRGGMETQAQNLAQGLLMRGHELITLTTPHPDGLSEACEADVPVCYIRPGSYRRYDPRWWEACYRELRALHSRRAFDVLLSHSAGALGYLPRVQSELKLPSVVVIHGTPMGEWRTHWRGARTLRGGYRLARWLARLPRLVVLWRRAVPFVERWIAVSREVAEEWEKLFALAPGSVSIIPNGVDTRRFRPDAQVRLTTRSRLQIGKDAPVLVAVGRLEHEKGFQIAIEALRQLLPRFPDARLLIAGAGHYRRALEREAAGLKDAVMFLGHVPNQELPELLAAADLFVMPTLCHEAFPLTVVEALASGLPVIASRAGGIASALDEGRTGMLVPMGDANAFARAMERLLHNEAMRAEMSRAACETATARYSREHMVEATEQVLEEAVARFGSG